MINRLLQEWRDETLPQHCAECGGQCCMRNLQNLTARQVNLISNNNPEIKNLDGRPLFVKKGKRWETRYANEYDGCPQLQSDNKCGIHDETDRPSACKNFPVFIYKELDIVRIDRLCPATRDLSTLADIIAKIREQGFTVYYGDKPLNPQQNTQAEETSSTTA